MSIRKWSAVLTAVLAGCLLTACKSSEAQNVETLIAAIGKVTETSDGAIRSAREAYEELDERDQGQIKNYSLLEQAEEDYDQILIGKVEETINAIGDIDENSAPRIQTAREAYEELSKAQQELVGNYDVLINAEKNYDSFIYEYTKTAILQLASLEPEEMEAAIAEADDLYSALSYEQKQKIEEDIGNVAEVIEQARQSNVEKLIARINYAKPDEPSKTQIKCISEAYQAYHALNVETRKNVKNRTELERAIKSFQKYMETRIKKDKLYARSVYIEDCQSVTADQLMTYPDSYKGHQVFLDVKVVEIVKNIGGETINAVTVEGESPISLVDKRAVKEPVIAVGETLTVYGEYTGTKTIRVKEEGEGWLGLGLFKKTQEQYKIPVVKFIYTSNDNLGVIASGNPGAESIAIDQEAEEMKAELARQIEEFGGM